MNYTTYLQTLPNASTNDKFMTSYALSTDTSSSYDALNVPVVDTKLQVGVTYCTDRSPPFLLLCSKMSWPFYCMSKTIPTMIKPNSHKIA